MRLFPARFSYAGVTEPRYERPINYLHTPPSVRRGFCSSLHLLHLLEQSSSPTYCCTASTGVSLQPRAYRWRLEVPTHPFTFHSPTDPSLSPNAGLKFNALFQPLLQVTFKSCPALCGTESSPSPGSAPAPAREATRRERLGNQTKVPAGS